MNRAACGVPDGKHACRTRLAATRRRRGLAQPIAIVSRGLRWALRHVARRGEVDAKRTRPGADLLAAMAMGLFLTARIDLADAPMSAIASQQVAVGRYEKTSFVQMMVYWTKS